MKYLPLLILAFLASGCATTTTEAPQIARISPEELEQLMPKAVPNLTLEDIVKLTKDGLAADAIIEKIKASQSGYALTPTQALELSKQGVDTKVLDFMHTQREQLLRDNVADEINKREQVNQQEQDKLRRQYNRQFYPFYDPFIHPYWGWGFGPRFRNRFYFGSGFW